MGNNEAKNMYDAVSLARDIKEREDIIDTFNRYGYLDRDNAMKKITELRFSDIEVGMIALAQQASGSIPLVSALDSQLVLELNNQLTILKAKLLNLSLADK